MKINEFNLLYIYEFLLSTNNKYNLFYFFFSNSLIKLIQIFNLHNLFICLYENISDGNWIFWIIFNLNLTYFIFKKKCSYI